MRGISKEYLESKINELYECADRGNDAINGLSAGANIAILKALLNECKELPYQQRQTIDEFKANPVDGWCWINLSGLVDMAYCWDGVFYLNDTTAEHNHDEIWDIRRITHVMPIKTPGAPK